MGSRCDLTTFQSSMKIFLLEVEINVDKQRPVDAPQINAAFCVANPRWSPRGWLRLRGSFSRLGVRLERVRWLLSDGTCGFIKKSLGWLQYRLESWLGA